MILLAVAAFFGGTAWKQHEVYQLRIEAGLHQAEFEKQRCEVEQLRHEAESSQAKAETKQLPAVAHRRV